MVGTKFGAYFCKKELLFQNIPKYSFIPVMKCKIRGAKKKRDLLDKLTKLKMNKIFIPY
jgi:hypothetical protein